jgi:hypothetical protein
LTLTGFETAEIDILLEAPAAHGPDDEADDVPEVNDSKPTVTRLGDLWLLGEHHLLCADATKVGSFNCLLGDRRAQVVFMDPPYNVPIDGNVSGLGAIKHREFVMASGEMSEAEFTVLLKTAFAHLVAHSIAGSIHFVCMDWRHCSVWRRVDRPRRQYQLAHLDLPQSLGKNGRLTRDVYDPPRLWSCSSQFLLGRSAGISGKVRDR